MTPADASLSPGRASIRYASAPDFGVPTLAEALDELRQEGGLSRLEVIIVNGGFDADFQREIMEKLREAVPWELGIALDPGGSTYANPELEPIHPAFDEVILETDTIRNISQQLAAIGKRISAVSHEKLSFRYLENDLVVMFFLYLAIEES